MDSPHSKIAEVRGDLQIIIRKSHLMPLLPKGDNIPVCPHKSLKVQLFCSARGELSVLSIRTDHRRIGYATIVPPMSRADDLLKSLETLRRTALAEDSALRAIKHLPAQEGKFEDYPADAHPDLVKTLRARASSGSTPTSAPAGTRSRHGKNAVVVTPTASGKTLCYNLPVLDAMVKDPSARALYLFPTKALANDQRAELDETLKTLPGEIRVFTYDGDTPQDARKAIRARGHIVLTNPDMLHSGILPHHTKWIKLFENLRYIVIDELHYYRGIFGCHLANVLRRLKRVAALLRRQPAVHPLHGHHRQPGGDGREDDRRRRSPWSTTTAPRAGEKYFLFYTPPVVNAAPGHPASSYVNETRRMASHLPAQRPADHRLRPEPPADRSPADLPEGGHREDDQGRGPHPRLPRRLPADQAPRDRERPARGQDPGRRLDQRPGAGHRHRHAGRGRPGRLSRAPSPRTWQRAGRAGRKTGASAALLVGRAPRRSTSLSSTTPTTSSAASRRRPSINPDNLTILISHIECASFELPFEDGDTFGRAEIGEILKFLEEEKLVHHSKDTWYWTSDAYPADGVSLRSISSDNFVVVDHDRPGQGHRRGRLHRRPDHPAREGHLHLRGRAVLRREAGLRAAQGLRQEDRHRLLHRRHRLHQDQDPGPVRQADARPLRRPPRRGPRGHPGRGLQEDQVPHHGERRGRRPEPAPERDAHHGLLGDGAGRPGPVAGVRLGGKDQRPLRPGLHHAPRGAAVPDVRHPRHRRLAGRQLDRRVDPAARPAGQVPGRAGAVLRRPGLRAQHLHLRQLSRAASG